MEISGTNTMNINVPSNNIANNPAVAENVTNQNNPAEIQQLDSVDSPNLTIDTMEPKAPTASPQSTFHYYA